MIVNTRRLFAKLLPLMQIDAVCDVGSMDGADALMFRRVLDRARIYALEPNPENVRLMQSDPALRRHDIQFAPFAVTNYDGVAELFLVEASSNRPWRAMSSLHRRPGGSEPSTAAVRTTRLDTFLSDKIPRDARLAVWIDAEGKAYEVIEGAAGVARQVHVIHVEVETSPCIGSNQKLYADVKALLNELGFVELATDQAHTLIQFNALFVRRDLPTMLKFRVRTRLAVAGLRRCVGRAVYVVCPACMHRFHALSQRSSRTQS